jgi:hypothetical protein
MMSTRREYAEIEKEYLQVSKLRAPLEARRVELSRRLLNPVDRDDFESASREMAENNQELLAISQRLLDLVGEMRSALQRALHEDRASPNNEQGNG